MEYVHLKMINLKLRTTYIFQIQAFPFPSALV